MAANTAIRIAIDKAGGVGALAAFLGITSGAVSQWKRVPDAHVDAVISLTGLPLKSVRPDLARIVTRYRAA